MARVIQDGYNLPTYGEAIWHYPDEDVVQLATVIPMTLKGASNQITMLIQTPHYMFWNFDATGYITAPLMMLFLALCFRKGS